MRQKPTAAIYDRAKQLSYIYQTQVPRAEKELSYAVRNFEKAGMPEQAAKLADLIKQMEALATVAANEKRALMDVYELPY